QEPAMTGAAQPAFSDRDRELALDIAAGLREIGAVSFTAGACDSEPSCLDAVRQRLVDIGEVRLKGLEARVEGGALVCVRATGSYYVLALEANVLGRDFVRAGDRRR